MSVLKRVLLVDDEPRFCDSLSQLLSLSNFSVTIAQSGKEAIEVLASHTFDVLLLDVELPDMLGYQILDSLQGENSGLATIMLTGNATLETGIAALKKGAYDYLKKPVDHSLLFSTMDKAIKHSNLVKALRLSEERSRTLVDASWEGIAIHNNGILLDTNKQFLDMFGYEADELIDKPVLQKLLSTVPYETNSTEHKKSSGSFLQTGYKKNGTKFPIETRCRKIEYHGETVQVCTVRDISKRVRDEQEKLDLQKKLAIANKMETLGLMAGFVAHDLNNILSGVVTLPELLLKQMGPSHKDRDTIETILKAGNEAASVVSDLLIVARGVTAEKRVCKPDVLIKNYLMTSDSHTSDSCFKDVDIQFDCNKDVANIYCSPVHINKILLNLVGNGAESIKGHGTVVVSVKNVSLTQSFKGYEQINAGDYVLIRVADDGPGINDADLKKIFEPFFSKKKLGRSGTGLGLAIVWNTVHDHGGFIDVQSNENGTTFDLYFPVTKKAFKEKKVLTIEKYMGKGETILVVDDQDQQLKIATNLLNDIGYKTAAVNSGEKAIEYVKTHSIDLIILDMNMDPGINGLKTYEEILKINPKQQAIIVSGFSENSDINQALRLGADQFIKKPYSLIQLGMAVKQALELM